MPPALPDDGWSQERHIPHRASRLRARREDYVVAASNGGSDWQPGWWLNLQSEPRATIEVDGAKVAITGRAVAERDRAELWQRLSEQLDSYDGYQRKVRRQIDLVRLQPVGSA